MGTLLRGGGENGVKKGKRGRRERRGEEVEGRISHTQKFWRGAPYAWMGNC